MKRMWMVFALAMAALASADPGGTTAAKTYKVSLTKPSRIGTNDLAPGDYKLAVDVSAVRVVEMKTGKSFEAAAKVENGDKKFGSTSITTQKVDGVDLIKEIRIGGSKVQIAFQ